MSDLIKRLRADEWASNATLRREAADRIAELEVENKNLRVSLEDACREVEARRSHGSESAADTDRLVESANNRIAELEAENERLKADVEWLESLLRGMDDG